MNYLNALPASLVTVFNLADRVAAVATAAADRAIAVWGFFTQPQAIATYKWLGRMALAFIELVIWSAIWAYAQVAKRFEPEAEIAFDYAAYATKVSDEIAQMTDAELEAEFNACFELPGMWESSDFLGGETDCPAKPQAMTPAIATLRLAPSTSHEDGLDREYELADMTLKQLVPIAAALNIPTRKVRKADLIDSIVHAEGYEV